MRLADRHGRPLSRVLAEYPAWELRYWQVWMAREPLPGHRVEYVLAQIAANHVNMNRKKGASPLKPADFMIPDYWQQLADQEHQANAKSDSDMITRMFVKSNAKIKYRKHDDNQYMDSN